MAKKEKKQKGIKLGYDFRPLDVFGINKSSSSSAAQQVIDRMPNPLAAGEEDKITASVNALTDNGDDTIEAFFGFMLEDVENRAQNWFSDTIGSASAFVASPTYVSGIGVSFNGTTQYFDSGVDLSTLSKYSLNDAHVSCYCYDNRDTGSGPRIFGVLNGAITSFVILPQTSNGLRGRIHEIPFLGYGAETQFSDNSRYGMKRDGAASRRLLINGASVANDTQASVVVPDNNLFFAAQNSNGTPANHIDATLSYGLIGATTSDDYDNFLDEVQSQWSL